MAKHLSTCLLYQFAWNNRQITIFKYLKLRNHKIQDFKLINTTNKFANNVQIRHESREEKERREREMKVKREMWAKQLKKEQNES